VSSHSDAPRPDVAPGQIRAAATVVLVEALALVGAAGVVLSKTTTGHPHDVFGALLLAALCLGGTVLLGLSARGVYRLRPAARTPIVVMQILALPVSYSLTFQAHRAAYGAPILIAALAVLYLLFTPPARAALDRDPDGSADS
jgi:hypothetical protein